MCNCSIIIGRIPRAIGRPKDPQTNEHKVHNDPDTKPTQRQQLEHPPPDMPQIEPVSGKPAKEEAQEKRLAPRVVGNNAALDLLLEGPGSKAHKVVRNRACCSVVLHRPWSTVPVRRAVVILFRRLETVLAGKCFYNHVCSLKLKIINK